MYAFAAGEYISILPVLQTLKQMTGTLLYEIIALSLTKRGGDIPVSFIVIIG
jgi:hypothetical protein